MPRFALLLAALLVAVGSSLLPAQGVLIDVHHTLRLPRAWETSVPTTTAAYQIEKLAVDARIQDQVARVQVSQTFKNTGSTQMEVQFLFPLPYDGAIDALTLLVNGEEWPAELLAKDKARARYEEIVRKSKDPALLEWMGHGMFQTSVFPVPAGESRTVTLHYNQILRKDQGVTDFLYPLSTAKYTCTPVQSLEFHLTIDSSIPIKNIYSPTHDVTIDRTGKKVAKVTFKAEQTVPTSDFRLFFDVNPKKLGTSVLSYRPDPKEDGFFLMMTTPQLPEGDEEVPKTILFVVDTSGSMSGEKFEQARGALKFVLNNLRAGDTFNIIAYSSSVESFRPELEKFTDETRDQALGYIEGLRAGGGTNIHDALSSALAQLKDKSQPSFIIFLTDGLPTVGERDELKIAQAARKANEVRARILNFGVGYDVNSRLLDRLGAENHGASEYVRPSEDIEAHVARVYSRVSAPVLTDVKIAFEMDELETADGKLITRVYPTGEFDLFAGEQMVLVGRYSKGGAAKVVVSGEVRDEIHTFDFVADLVEKSNDQSYVFVEKLWAMRRIGEIIDELDLNGANQELTDELVLLSTQHGILTPYTSFLADEAARPTQLAESDAFRRNAASAGIQLEALDQAAGESGVSQRAEKQRFLGAAREPAADSQFYSLEDRAAGLSAAGGGGAITGPADGRYRSALQGGAIYRDSATDELVVAETIRKVGPDTLYKRGDIFCTSETAELFDDVGTLQLDLVKLGDKVEVIERFTDAYFALCVANTTQENQLFASQMDGEQLLVNLRGKAYLIK